MATTESQTTPPGRIERKRSRKIREILMATAEVLHKDGYHAMNLEDVADKVDLTKATLYHYFGGKDELVSSSLELVGNEVTARLKALADSMADEPAGEALRALLTEQLTIVLVDYPEASRLFAQPLEWPAEHRQLIRRLREQHDAVFRGVMERGVASGEFVTDDLSIPLHCIYGALNYAPLWVRRASRPATTKIIDSTVDALMKMLA